MSHFGNQVGQVRPESTFENFKIYDEEQRPVVEGLEGVAEKIVAMAPAILKSRYPFPSARILFLHSPPGHGKTHLAEAIINRIAERAPEIITTGKLYLSRYNFTYEHQSGVSDYGGAPIVIHDDVFSEHNSIGGLHDATDIPAFMRFIAGIYERRTLAILTSNFPLMAGIVARVRHVDRIGRITSRMNELLMGSGEIALVGKDYRMVKATEPRHGGFFL